jgi:endonuclease YncB( thermonuclease family)
MIDGQVVPVGRDATRSLRTILDGLRVGEPIALSVRRADQTIDVTVVPVAACDFETVVVAEGDINAYADGERVIIPWAMMRFANDDELVGVLGHEVAHNAMGHIDARMTNAMLGGIFGAILDVAAATQGVNTGGQNTSNFMAAASKSFSQDFEREADYVGMYILARAGKSLESVPNFWRQFAQINPSAISYASTHPTTAERFVRLRMTAEEIARKRDAAEPLLPNPETRTRSSSRGAPAPASTSSSYATTVPAGATFVASSSDRVYYWTGCSAWRSLSPGNLRYFATRSEAGAAGYTPSGSSECAGPPDTTAPQDAPVRVASSAAPGLISSAEPAGTTGATCTVAIVVDGDTLDCTDGRRVRLLLIDAPEIDQGTVGAAAKEALESLAPVGVTLRMETDVEILDPYGRTLAHLYGESPWSINRRMLQLGFAVVSVFPPNVRYVAVYRTTSLGAQLDRQGLWALDAFACAPADFRAGLCN